MSRHSGVTAYDRALENYTRFDDWYLWVQMHKGTVSMPVFQSLEAFWPGLQVALPPTSSCSVMSEQWLKVLCLDFRLC